MTPRKNSAGEGKLKELLLEDEDLLRGLMKQALEQVLEGEMSRRCRRARASAALVVRIFPNDKSCLRLVRALAVEVHENWIEAIRYLNMDSSGGA